MSIKPFDEITVEEAIRFKANGVAPEIVTVSIGLKRIRRRLGLRSR